MICPVCKGSGITTVTLLRVVYNLGARCGGCGGTGVISDMPDDRPLFDKMVSKHVELQEAISEISGLPSNLKRRWYDHLDSLHVTQENVEAALKGLQREVDEAEDDYPECDLALIYTGLGDLSRMCAEYRNHPTA
jgi:regulator of sirC expression with transglutaminase-like and TPR domain